MREENRLQIVRKIIKLYDGKEPLIRFLKKYYRLNPAMGSRDRRIYSGVIFNYFRLGCALPDESVETRIAVSSFLCSRNELNDLIVFMVNNYSALDINLLSSDSSNKIKHVEEKYPGFSVKDIVPFGTLFSDNINHSSFSAFILSQPGVWLRIRKSFRDEVIMDLNKNKISFHHIMNRPSTLFLAEDTKTENVASYQNGYFEIQDLASQKAGELIPVKKNDFWWDVCCGSGGKSLQMIDRESTLRLFCTDNRSAILKNLTERFKKSGVTHYHSAVYDASGGSELELPKDNRIGLHFDGIVADVPCSGSGIWARSPEQISYFDHSKIESYSEIQKKIISNCIKYLKPGGVLAYITCSVFKIENENNVTYFSNHLPLELIKSELIDESAIGGGVLFAALFRKK